MYSCLEASLFKVFKLVSVGPVRGSTNSLCSGLSFQACFVHVNPQKKKKGRFFISQNDKK